MARDQIKTSTDNDQDQDWTSVTGTQIGSKRALDVVSHGAGSYIIQIDKTTTANTTYYGWADPGTLTSAASWKVMRKTESGCDSTYLLADSDANFDNIWDNRASLSYG